MLARINRNYKPVYWDDFFNDRFFNSVNEGPSKTATPSVNVIEEDKEFVIEVALPGLGREDFNIEVEEDVLSIFSVEKEDKEDKKRNYTLREFTFKNFKRSFQLPDTIDQERIEANHKNGVLSITLHKKEEMVEKAPRQIKIK